MQILCVDRGLPDRWLWPDEAAHYYATGRVLYELGDVAVTLHGGHNRLTGRQSLIDCRSIIAVADSEEAHRPAPRGSLKYSKEMLILRDRCVCCYCGQRYPERKLEGEHILPRSRGGRWTWMNMVLSCRACNAYKGARTPEEAGMDMYYVPYAPNAFEARLLENRRVLADQMEFLLAGVPEGSRALS